MHFSAYYFILDDYRLFQNADLLMLLCRSTLCGQGWVANGVWLIQDCVGWRWKQVMASFLIC